MIQKVAIRNYRMLRNFDLAFTPGVNIVVGKNDTGKSTLIEAISIALTGRLHGRPFSQELSPYLINRAATLEYTAALLAGNRPVPPAIVIEVYLENTDETAPLRGTNNLHNEDACGVRMQVTLSQEFAEEYAAFLALPGEVRLVPTEYYKADWLSFAGTAVSARGVPAAVSVIDSTTIRLLSGVDYHLQQIIRTHLAPRERVELARQYRSLREEFGTKQPVRDINDRLRGENDLLSDRTLSLAIDISQGANWEGSLVAHVDDLPFQLLGRGEQNALKTLLAIGQRANDAQVILVEEPETHLAFGALRKLIERIEQRCAGRQLVIATHSTYVLNKLGLDRLVVLGERGPSRIADLPAATVDFFKKLPGFDTLRLALADAAILVEGPSDELVLQRGYLDAKGRLPIEDGIDVISVGLSHKRFLDLALRLGRRVWVVTDNDGKARAEMEARFVDYLGSELVTLHFGEDPTLPTLEPQIVAANDLDVLNAVLGDTFKSKDEACAFMSEHKTAVALAIFESATTLTMPDYIRRVIES